MKTITLTDEQFAGIVGSLECELQGDLALQENHAEGLDLVIATEFRIEQLRTVPPTDPEAERCAAECERAIVVVGILKALYRAGGLLACSN